MLKLGALPDTFSSPLITFTHSVSQVSVKIVVVKKVSGETESNGDGGGHAKFLISPKEVWLCNLKLSYNFLITHGNFTIFNDSDTYKDRDSPCESQTQLKSKNF